MIEMAATTRSPNELLISSSLRPTVSSDHAQSA